MGVSVVCKKLINFLHKKKPTTHPLHKATIGTPAATTSSPKTAKIIPLLNTKPDFLMGYKADTIRLSMCENPFGPSPKAIKAIQQGVMQAHRYANPGQLIHALATYHGVDPSMVICTNGSTELLKIVPQAYLANGGSMVTTRQTYKTAPNAAEALGRDVLLVNHKPDWSYNIDALLKAIRPDTKLLYLVNPNNPTGAALDYDKLKGLAQSIPKGVILFIDEAYAAFLPENGKGGIDLIKEGFENIFVTRTFSKVHGLAGLRIGYGIGSPETIEKISVIQGKPHVDLNIAGVWGALASLDDQDHVNNYIKHADEAREFYKKELDNLGLEYISGHAPYIAVKIPGDTQLFTKSMEKKGIFIRDASEWGMPGYIRISFGLNDENKRVIETLKETIQSPVTAGNTK